MNRPSLRTVASRTATAVGAAVITTMVVAGGLSVAQAATESVPNNSVTSAKIVNGTIQGIDVKDGAIGPADLSVNARPRWAKVSGGTSGALLRGRGVASSSRIGTGTYRVTFDAPVTRCGWTATRNDNGAGLAGAGQISIEQESPADATTLLVNTYNPAGTPTDTAADDGFTLVLSC